MSDHLVVIILVSLNFLDQLVIFVSLNDFVVGVQDILLLGQILTLILLFANAIFQLLAHLGRHGPFRLNLARLVVRNLPVWQLVHVQRVHWLLVRLRVGVRVNLDAAQPCHIIRQSHALATSCFEGS